MKQALLALSFVGFVDLEAEILALEESNSAIVGSQDKDQES